MAAGFDPYHRWLSIPPLEQLPTHYRLLGLQPFEASFEVIENAAERQIAHVRSFLDTPLRPYAVNLISELDVARKCLLDSEAKAAYDACLEQRASYQADPPTPHFELHASNSVVRAAAGTASANRTFRSSAGDIDDFTGNWVNPVQPDDSASRTSYFPGEQLSSYSRVGFAPSIVVGQTRRRGKSSGTQFAALVSWIIGAAIGLLAGYAVICMIDPKYDFLHVMFPDVQIPRTHRPPTSSRKFSHRR